MSIMYQVLPKRCNRLTWREREFIDVARLLWYYFFVALTLQPNLVVNLLYLFGPMYAKFPDSSYNTLTLIYFI